jgi:hypothetical protein
MRSRKPERWQTEPTADGGVRIAIKLPPDFNYEVFAAVWQKTLSDAIHEEIEKSAHKFLYGEGDEKPIGFLRNKDG